MELFRANVVDAKTMLENSSYPFASRILEAIKRNEQQAAQGVPMEGIPPELLTQLGGAPLAEVETLPASQGAVGTATGEQAAVVPEMPLHNA